MRKTADSAGRIFQILRACWKRSSARSRSTAPEGLRFVILFKPGPKWVAGRPLFDQPLKAHLEYMQKLYKQGKLLYAGPFGNDSGGLAVLAPASEAEAYRILAEEPATRQKIFVAEMHRWQLTFDVTQNRSLLLRKQVLQ